MKETILYRYLRPATCASLIAFTAAIAVGAPILLFRTIEQTPAVSVPNHEASTASPRLSRAEIKGRGSRLAR